MLYNRNGEPVGTDAKSTVTDKIIKVQKIGTIPYVCDFDGSAELRIRDIWDAGKTTTPRTNIAKYTNYCQSLPHVVTDMPYMNKNTAYLNTLFGYEARTGTYFRAYHFTCTGKVMTNLASDITHQLEAGDHWVYGFGGLTGHPALDTITYLEGDTLTINYAYCIDVTDLVDTWGDTVFMYARHYGFRKIKPTENLTESFSANPTKVLLNGSEVGSGTLELHKGDVLEGLYGESVLAHLTEIEREAGKKYDGQVIQAFGDSLTDDGTGSFAPKTSWYNHMHGKVGGEWISRSKGGTGFFVTIGKNAFYDRLWLVNPACNVMIFVASVNDSIGTGYGTPTDKDFTTLCGTVYQTLQLAKRLLPFARIVVMSDPKYGKTDYRSDYIPHLDGPLDVAKNCLCDTIDGFRNGCPMDDIMYAGDEKHLSEWGQIAWADFVASKL